MSDVTSNATTKSTINVLCLFLNTGKTFTFRNVVVDSDNETAITFTYIAMSDDLPKRATFYKSHVAGVSRTS